MTVLVTGATGFTGWHVASRLRAGGHEVRVLARSREKADKLLRPLGIAETDIVEGDMADADAVARALDGCVAVVHAAAAVSVTSVGGDAAFEANVRGTRLVVGGACERGFESVVFVSSLTAIFDPRGGETTAQSPLVESATRYGRSKAESDAFVRELECGGAPVAILYPSAIIGPQDPGLSESVRAFRGFTRTMIDSSGGTQFVDVRDLAILIEKLLESHRPGRYVAAGDFFTWGELVTCIEEVTGASIRRLSAPGWLLRAAGRLGDGVSRLTRTPSPMTREAMEIATRWRAIADSPGVAELGVRWRDPRETLADLYQWLVEVGRLPPHAVPRLTQELRLDGS